MKARGRQTRSRLTLVGEDHEKPVYLVSTPKRTHYYYMLTRIRIKIHSSPFQLPLEYSETLPQNIYP